mgnify:CR=1 FL=1
MRKLYSVFALLLVASMILASCQAAPATQAPAQQEQPTAVVQTVIVEKEGETKTIVVTATPEPNAAAPTEAEAGPALLRVNLGTYPDTIDPQKSSFVNEIAHLKLIYEGLTRLNGNLETVPGAAESWEYNEDATQLTFKLRPGLTYSDGTPLNAKRFEYSLIRNIDPATAGEYASITDEIVGASEWRTTDISAEGYDPAPFIEALGVKALDDAGNPCTDYEQANCLTLQIKLRAPAPYFHTVMSLWVTFPAKEENITEGGDIWWTSSKYQIGNGPFILSSIEPFVRGYFTPNPNYWGNKPTYDLEFRYITDSAVAFEAYKNNEFDIIPLAAEDLPAVQADPELNAQAKIYPGSCTFNMNFHQLKEPFTDKKVREAFIYALDREAWVRDVLNGLGAPTLTWIPPGFPGYDAEETRYAFDPEAAKQALAESSYGSVDKLPPITLTFSDTPRNRVRNEWLANQWKTVLGVDISLNPVEPTTYTALTKDVNTAPQTFILGWCADYPDPQNWLSVYWMSTSTFAQRIGFANEELDAIMKKADATVDPEERMKLYAEAQKMLVGLAPGAFFWNNVNAYLIKPWVQGVVTTPMDAGWPGDYVVDAITVDTAAQQGVK